MADSPRWVGKLWDSIAHPYRTFKTWERNRAERICQVPPNHLLVRKSKIDDSFSDHDRSMIDYVRKARYLQEHGNLLLDYEQHTSRADYQGRTWTENARRAYDYYETEVWAYAAMGAIMTSGSSVPGEFYRQIGQSVDEREVFTNAITERLLDEPNPEESFQDLVEGMLGYGELTGMALFDIGDRLAGGLRINSLWSIPPDAVWPLGDKCDLITDWVYRDPHGQERRVDPEQIAWLRQWRPGIARLGMGSLQPAANALLELQAIREWSIDNFRNNWELKGGVLEHPRKIHGRIKKRMLDEWGEVHYPGSRIPFIADDGAKYVAPDVGSGRKGDYIDLRKEARLEVLAAFGVTPVMVGLTEGVNYANSKEQKSVFWENTEQHKLNKLARMITHKICPLIAPGLQFRFKLETVPYLDPTKIEREQGMREEVQLGLLSVEEYRRRQMYGEKSKSETFYLPPGSFPMQLSTEEKAEDVEADPDIDPNDDGGDEGGGGLPSDNTEPADAETLDTTTTDPDTPVISVPDASAWTNERSLETHLSYIQRQSDSVKQMVAEIQPIWREQEARLLAEMDGENLTLSASPAIQRAYRVSKSAMEQDEIERRIFKDLSLDDLFDFMTEQDRQNLVNVINRAGLRVIQQDGESTIVDIFGQPADQFSVSQAVVDDFLVHSNNIVGTASTDGMLGTARKRLTRTLSQGISNGEGLRDLRNRVQNVYNQMSNSHAVMVARTEVAAAQNFGIVEGFSIGGAAGKTWLAMPGSERHAAPVDGQTVGVRDPFMVNGSAMQFPGDFRAPYSETHNCRCTMIPELN